MASASAPGGTDEFTYNADSDLESASGPSGASSYEYNADGLVSSETDAAGTTSYAYDDADRVSTESDPLTGSVLTYGYNADSNPTSVSYASGGTAGPTETLGYDGLQRETSDTLTSASGTTLASESYGYDSDGNLTSESAGGLLPASSTTYGYDEADRLASATAGGSTVNYGYDADGNLTRDGSASNTYNAQDQLTSSADGGGTTDYGYTLNGDLSQVTSPSGSTGDYGFDAYGDLASVPGGVSYGYDGLGRPVTRADSSGTTSLSYLGTGGTVASDGADDYSYDPSGDLTGEGAAGGPAGSGQAVLSDIHGDVTAAFSPDASATSLAGTASYSPYGTGTATGSMPGLGYQDDYTDPATGLVEMGARWYDPATGGFTSSDTSDGTPVPSTVDGNPYAYAYGNPLTGTDPTGHFMELQPGGGAAVAAPATVGCLAFIEICAAGVGAVAVGAGIGFGIWYLTGGSSGPGSQSLPGSGNFLQQYLDGLSAPGSGGAGLSPTTATPDDAQSPDDYLQDNPGASLDDGATPGPCGFYACPPPPPPPPPQDIYAEGAKIQKASKSLLDDQVITQVVKDVTSASKLLGGAGSIKETVKPATTTVQGTTAGSSNTAGDAGDIGQDVQQLVQSLIQDEGEPAEPQAAAAGSGGGGSGVTTIIGTDAWPDEPGGSGSGSFGSRVAGAAKSLWPGGKQLAIGCAAGAAGNYLSGVLQKQTGSQLWEDIGLGCGTGALSNMGTTTGIGLGAGFVAGGFNGVGSQMISSNSWDPGKVNYWWALTDAGLGTAENGTGSYLTKDLPVDGDLSPGNYASGGAGILTSGVCGALDNSEVQQGEPRRLEADC
jgi:RHS repeat-associated protein